MFRASICPSSGVQVVCYCIWCSALGVVAVVLRSRCVVLCTVCKFVSDMHGHAYIKDTATFSTQFRICGALLTTDYSLHRLAKVWSVRMSLNAHCRSQIICRQLQFSLAAGWREKGRKLAVCAVDHLPPSSVDDKNYSPTFRYCLHTNTLKSI